MLKRKKKVIAKVMATTMLATTIATTFGIEAKADSISPRTAVSSSKIAGNDRYKTAVEISKNYSSSSKHAVIVNGQKGIVDALTATPYASLKNAPILMTQSDKLNADTKAELTRRQVKTVDIVGGLNSVNDSVKSEIQAMGITVNRIAGNSKYDTALEVAKKIDDISDISKIAVANGEVLADAVSVAAPAAQNEMPIILAHPKNGLDDKTKAYINGEGVNTSYVIGGTNSVSSTTQNSLPGTKKRLEGSGRQDTNAAVVKEFYTSSSYDNVYVTKSGQVNKQDEIADALAVGVLAAKEQDPVVIVGKSLATSQSNLLKDKKFNQVTEIGNGIPSASINGIKDTQKAPEDPEAIVSSVSLVNYNTIKIVGKELKRIDGNKIEISGNSVSSYTVNEAGTEAKVVFNKTFNSGTNTVKITSNLGKTTTHNFTYSTEISSVEAVTSEIGLDGIQYLEFTVNNGQKRSVEELESLGWKVKFTANQPVFYELDGDKVDKSKESTTGLLKTTEDFTTSDSFWYKVTLTKGTKEFKTSEKVVTCKDKNKDVKEIRDTTFMLQQSSTNEVEMNSKTLLIGEKLKVKGIDITNLNGSKVDGVTDGYSIESSNSNVLPVLVDKASNTVYLQAKADGKATITVKMGDVKKIYDITVNEATESNKRKPNSYKFEKTSIKMLNKEDNSEDVKVTITDKYGDPIPSASLNQVTCTNKVTSNSKSVAIAKLEELGDGNKKGEFNINITPALDSTFKTATGTVKLQYDGKDMSGTNLSVSVSSEISTSSTYKLNTTSSTIDVDLDRYRKQDDNTLELQLEEYTSAGYLKGKVDVALGNNIGQYVVETSNSDIISKDNISNENKNLKINLDKDGKEGSATITLYIYEKNSKGEKIKTKRGDIKINVEDTTPRIKEITLNKIDPITEFKKEDNKHIIDFKVEDLFKINKMGINGVRNIIDPRTLKLTGTQKDNITDVSIDFRETENENPVIFIDVDKDGKYNIDKKDELLATIVMEHTDGIKAEVDNKYQIKFDDNKDQDGSINVRIYNGEYNETKTQLTYQTLNVKIDK
ncbi:cell wall-binding repeat-containing protein [Romboutsia lituseburensis]|uniref:Putative cell wall binding repeat 2 n=1 Tax=Romboutsia lituseburensis DSM 797 TaxID=1121325 RepID=A0A1G9QRH6_9FIRM|nr:cell wall-binding repeat-containing protein [Romboutsia lituseburensis]CEH35629.1 Cell wall protein V domain protein [Romboutsia lituseburensis]SDM13167.1 Putative cell wall binding repeat 2 [Romboutsia lituseburensis DSM 797]